MEEADRDRPAHGPFGQAGGCWASLNKRPNAFALINLRTVPVGLVAVLEDEGVLDFASLDLLPPLSCLERHASQDSAVWEPMSRVAYLQSLTRLIYFSSCWGHLVAQLAGSDADHGAVLLADGAASGPPQTVSGEDAWQGRT